MPHEFETTPRLTPEQRDRVLDIAARLQAQHESMVGVGDLAEAAAEAGIEERFVHQAVRAMAAQDQVQAQAQAYAPPTAAHAETTAALALMVLLAIVNIAMCYTPLRAIATSVFGFVPVAFAAAAAFLGTRGRLPSWTVPIFIVASYGLARGLGFALRKLDFMSSADYVRTSVHAVLAVEFCAAVVATLAVLAVRSVRRPQVVERHV